MDPINGIFDSLFVVPTYSVSPHTPLTVNLDFVVNGDFRKGYLGDVTYLFYKKKPSNLLSFLKYRFEFVDNNWIVQSSIRFTPHPCSLTESELMAQFNNVKSENHFYSDQGSNIIKLIFICFLNGVNRDYEVMMTEFTKAPSTPLDDPYTYNSYVYYLNKFIVNFTPQ